MSSQQTDDDIGTIEDASKILMVWNAFLDRDLLGPIVTSTDAEEPPPTDPILAARAIQFLNDMATKERDANPANGRCMLGICAGSAQEGIATLKAFVTSLGLPRGLLHGFDKDGVPIELDGAVFIKYNSGGVYTFEEIRKSGMGFDALWKPGDALLEPYDGTRRCVYFQVELSDREFRQYAVPLDTFTLDDR